MARLTECSFTIAEAAYVVGLTSRHVNHEIDERIIRPVSARGDRVVRGADLLYLGAIRNIRTHLKQPLRQRIAERS